MAVVYDQATVRTLEAQFLRDLEHCTEWTLAAYRRAPVVRRLLDSLYRLASPLL
jgi:hypothetical protein